MDLFFRLLLYVNRLTKVLLDKKNNSLSEEDNVILLHYTVIL